MTLFNGAIPDNLSTLTVTLEATGLRYYITQDGDPEQFPSLEEAIEDAMPDATPLARMEYLQFLAGVLIPKIRKATKPKTPRFKESDRLPPPRQPAGIPITRENFHQISARVSPETRERIRRRLWPEGESS